MNKSFSCCVLISNCSICIAANMNGKRNVLFSEFVAYFPFNCKCSNYKKLIIFSVSSLWNSQTDCLVWWWYIFNRTVKESSLAVKSSVESSWTAENTALSTLTVKFYNDNDWTEWNNTYIYQFLWNHRFVSASHTTHFWYYWRYSLAQFIDI